MDTLDLLENLDLSSIQDENIRKCLLFLLNLCEELKQENQRLRAENQRLRDEINQLKGEQGKPKIKGNTPKPPLNVRGEQEEVKDELPKMPNSES